MDPSSSNSLEPGGTHRVLESKQVFLCHSGVQKDFVEVLWEEVLRSDRSAFFDIDRDSLPIGVHFPHYIFDTIKQCQLENLRKRSLIEDWGDGSRRIGMHDLWIEFARAEAKGGDSKERAWLYEPVYGANDERRKASCLVGGGWKKLQRIYLKGSTNGRGVLKSINLKKCPELTVLKVVGVHIESGVLDLRTAECLKSLEIVGFGEHSASVKNICGLGSVKNLVVMRLSAIDFSSQFIDEVKVLTNLEVLHLPVSIRGPRYSSKLPDLSRLSLLSNVKLCSAGVSTISG